MPFTAPQISHTFQNADGTAASGSIQFSLLSMMTNGSTSLVPAELTANLDSSGNLLQVLMSNVDPGTTPIAPANAQWRADLRILGAQVLTYVLTVPPIQIESNGSIVTNALNVVQLSSLTATEFMVGQSIVCVGHIPSGTTILSVNTTTNTVTMSANGTVGTALSITLGTTIDLAALLPSAQQL